jgi:hypothetical protein
LGANDCQSSDFSEQPYPLSSGPAKWQATALVVDDNAEGDVQHILVMKTLLKGYAN